MFFDACHPQVSEERCYFEKHVSPVQILFMHNLIGSVNTGALLSDFLRHGVPFE